MRLSDIVGAANLSIYAQIGLVAALVAFAAVIYYLLSRRNRATFEKARMMPLDDETVRTPRDDGNSPQRPANHQAVKESSDGQD